jgi:hypothetical protein
MRRVRHINIVYKCQRTPDGDWAPAFEVTVIQGGEMLTTRTMSAIDSRLTFATKQEAEAASDATAREWCAENYPGWPVQLK